MGSPDGTQVDTPPLDTLSDNILVPIKTFSNSNLFALPILIKNIYSIDAIIDSGADNSVISKEILTELSLRFELKTQENVASHICLANGVKVKHLGSVFLDVRIKDQYFCVKFIIMENLNLNVILGQDFLKSTNATIEFSKPPIIRLHFQKNLLDVLPGITPEEEIPLAKLRVFSSSKYTLCLRPS